MTENQTIPVSDDDYRLPDEELRRLAESPGRWSRPLAQETLALRARVTELEATLEAKRGQHLDTLHYLEQAQRVIERDSAAYGRLLRVLWKSRRAAQEQVDQLRSGGKFLGKAIAELNQIALDATDMHDVINENGDGDWQVVWETIADLGADLRAARKRIADLERQLDDAISVARSNSHALDAVRAEIAELQAQVQR